MDPVIAEVKKQVKNYREDIIQFLRDIVAIPSPNGSIGQVVQRIAEEMKKLGYDDVFFDHMGNVVGRIGRGEKVLLYDSHVDTVDVADPSQWEWDPYQGKIENGIFYGLGACDEKGSTPGMVYGLKIARDLGLLEGYTAYYFGNLEEVCDGIAPHSLVETDKIRPDFVVIGEPTNMRIYRGHRGRIEMKVVTKGRTCHASAPERGENAVYKMAPIIEAISQMGAEFLEDPFLGKGSIAVTDIHCKTPSINALPDECTIFIDRRLTFGETWEMAVEQVRKVAEPYGGEVEVLIYDEPSYNGFVFKVDKYFPAWALPEEHFLVQAGVETCEKLYGYKPEIGKWVFSTNGIYWMGKANIPAIGFGPGNEIYAHTVKDQVPLDDVVKATEFYALFPAILRTRLDNCA
ncbi:putative selenium metabolism hydrolase [Thermanaeromonas toyohensis ToBE]|uniref:Putative selenium metabolism hydrolase n=1 Tax=Thermanaeromonas toyohensis ToBE TaxID=698762 RepID=A0A1W1W1F1_9FIRM|nr:YgeY family selenium metabolism-linked hydrolase [Thermanaeromonas toyohensis]SMB99462.1 putative selenium metabolism hydrolase [Thermanaeromonas toyohensis ToBE]